MKISSLPIAVILLVYFSSSTQAHNTQYVVDEQAFSEVAPHVVTLDHIRQKRAVPPDSAPPAPAPTPSAAAAPAFISAPGIASPKPAVNGTASNATGSTYNTTISDDSNRTTNVSKTTAPTAIAVVTQVPFLGANGTGQRWTNMTGHTVSDPLSPEEEKDLEEAFETPEKIQSEHHLPNVTYDAEHEFYNSSFIGNLTYFNEYWANITKAGASPHAMLSNSHRRATAVPLSFKFPFYGNWIQSITVATGGFMYTGEHAHAWLAATQYIAPLMANFDTSLHNDSMVSISDDGEKFTAFWENVVLCERPDQPFTFAVTLHKNGDIVFAYKNVPVAPQNIDDTAHPVKIGISDAYLTDRVIFYVRRKTIYEYHRASFKHYEISNNTILKLTALPTCLQYNSCDTCLNHNTAFDCAWCENIKKCSSGTDRNKQDWQLRNCDKTQVTNASQCPGAKDGRRANDTNTAYVTDGQPDGHEAVVNTLNVTDHNATIAAALPTAGTPDAGPDPAPAAGSNSAFHADTPAPVARSGIGGVVVALVAATLVASAAAWALYAFKNPHTRSGQILIKYRPSQWSWRRGEARYTAAVIHM